MASTKSKKSTGKASSGRKAAPKGRPPTLVYPTVTVSMFIAKDQSKPLRADTAKELLGWREESENVKFKSDYLFKTRSGVKVRCTHNNTNRPFYARVAGDMMLEILRRKWRFNGEPIVVDRLGNVQNGQHRLVGLCWAVEEYYSNIVKWKPFWGDAEPYLETLLVTGISDDDDVVNTIDIVKPRSVADLVYRSTLRGMDCTFSRKDLSRIVANAIKMLWHRTGASEESFAPNRPHSEAVDFLNRHKRLIECAQFTYGERESLRTLMPLGYASAMLYLMAASGSDLDSYTKTNDESNIDWSLWDKAKQYWTALSCHDDAVKAVHHALVEVDAVGRVQRDEACAILVKGWKLYAAGKPATLEAVRVAKVVDDFGRNVLAEQPGLGGIDTAGG